MTCSERRLIFLNLEANRPFLHFLLFGNSSSSSNSNRDFFPCQTIMTPIVIVMMFLLISLSPTRAQQDGELFVTCLHFHCCPKGNFIHWNFVYTKRKMCLMSPLHHPPPDELLQINKLRKRLLKDQLYQRNARPVLRHSTVTNVSLTVFIRKIVDLELSTATLTTYVTLNMVFDIFGSGKTLFHNLFNRFSRSFFFS